MSDNQKQQDVYSIIDKYGDDAPVPEFALVEAGIETLPGHTYHTAYGDLIAAENGEEVAYWVDDFRKWKCL